MKQHAMNLNRAGWAANAVEHFADEVGLCGDPAETAIGDLICDLGHYCDKLGLDFLELTKCGISNWKIEQYDPDGLANPPVVTIHITPVALPQNGGVL